MSLPLRDFGLAPADRVLWRRAIDELLIDAIFGDLPPTETLIEPAAHECGIEPYASGHVLIAAE